MRAVFADTGPLFALIDPDDEHHGRAEMELARLADDGYDLIVAFPTMVETYKLILRSLGIAPAHRWLGEAERRTILFNPTPEDYREASLRIRRYPDQAITIEDATLATLGDRLEISIWSFDHHFDIMRARVWR